MEKIILIKGVYLLLVGSMLVTPMAQAESSTENQSSSITIEGVVQSVTGSRITIKLSDGQSQTVTTKGSVSADLVGKTIAGNIKPAGDTTVISDFVIKN